MFIHINNPFNLKLFINKLLLWPVQKHINNEVTSLNMIKKYKQTPVNQPCTLLKQVQRRTISIRINILS